MPAGCDFICDNLKCEQHRSGVIITGYWQLGEIDKVINAQNVQKNEGLKSGLIKLRDEGRKYSCINYPNFDDIPVVGYRVQKWCRKCPAVWAYEVLLDEENQSVEDAIKKADIPDRCIKCGEALLDYAEVLEEGIKCPVCNKEMVQSRWFSSGNPEGKEEDRQKLMDEIRERGGEPIVLKPVEKIEGDKDARS